MDKQYLKWLAQVREHEMNLLLAHFPPIANCKILEIGGGTGQQAAMLAGRGWNIESVDIATSVYATERIFPVTQYDGHHLPFPDASFDIIFSSNVLAHVPHLDEFEKELARVLRPGGYAIHVLPSHQWRLWTSLVHYPALSKIIMRAVEKRLGRQRRNEPELATQDNSPSIATWGVKLRTLLQAIVAAPRIGARGTAMSEYFVHLRTWWWEQHFESHGFDVEESFAMGVFYTGYMLLKSHLSIQRRADLARVLGSSTNCFVLRNRN